MTPLGVAALGLTMVNVGKGGDGHNTLGPRAAIGLSIAPLPLDLNRENKELVGLGSYLVNAAGDCNGCHSTSEYVTGGNPFLGQPKVIDTTTYLRGGRAFGPIISRNLLPEAPLGHPAGLTYDQFVSAMRHGTDFDNPGQLLQVMPWPTFQNMADEDLRAIYHYLQALRPAAAPGD